MIPPDTGLPVDDDGDDYEGRLGGFSS